MIIGGDLLEGGVPLLRARQNIQKLKTLGPVYFVWGNNDYEVSQVQLKQMLKDEGVITLKTSMSLQFLNMVLHAILRE